MFEEESSGAGPNVIRRMLHRARSNLGSSLLRNSDEGTSVGSTTYQRVIVEGDDGDKDFRKCCGPLLAPVINLRSKFKASDKGEDDALEGDVVVGDADGFVTMVDGVYLFEGQKTPIMSWSEYVAAIDKILEAVESGPCLTTARARLKTLEEKFELYVLLNTDIEEEADKKRRGGGVYANATKVNNSVRLATCVNASALVETITGTIKENPTVGTIPHSALGEATKNKPLSELLKQHNVEHPETITVEGLGLHPSLTRKRFHRYDALDEQLNPAGALGADLLRSFLTREGSDDGALFGLVVRPVLEKQEYAHMHLSATEMKVTLNGTHPTEWLELADWISEQGLGTYHRNMWVIEIKRVETERRGYQCETNADQLRHIFYPLFMATLFPEDSEWITLAQTLRKVSGFSVLSDETSRAKKMHVEPRPPQTIPWSENVNDYYFFYYLWANLTTLNALRRRRGLNVFKFCPVCPDIPGHLDHLVTSYLLADSIHRGTKLVSSWILQYLYMIHRIGVVMSPLADNALHINYQENSFITFFKRGLTVTLATDDALYYHHQPDSLVEEYGTAMKIFNMTPTDMCEVMRNSCLVSNFPHETKATWLGTHYNNGPDGNDSAKTNVCDFRLQFRHECLEHEQSVINLVLTEGGKKENPNVITLIKPRKSANDSKGLLHDIRKLRRINYLDRRIAYPRVDLLGTGQAQSTHFQTAADLIRQVLNIRRSYANNIPVTSDVNVEDVFQQTAFDESIWEYNSYYGVFLLSRIGVPPPWPQYIPTAERFIHDVQFIKQVAVGNNNVAQLASHRLELLEHRFKLHLGMNIEKEAGTKEEKSFNNRDIFTSHKVDNNVHTDAGMNSRTLLDFFAEKALNNGHDVVFEEDNEPVTLRELLERLKINASQIAVDELHSLVQQNQQIRNIFLSTENFLQGRYFAELTKRTLELYKLDEFTFSENRLRLFGKSQAEWPNLAMWFDRYGMASSQNRWMVNLPRGYRKLRRQNIVKTFAEYLDNIFLPLWEVSLHPAKNPKFHYFLTHVSGFDCVDDESKVDLPLSATFPHDWNSDLNPPFNYYLYYYWANIVSLNHFRASRGLSTFTLRPQCGELGGMDHLIGGFLLANSVNHGVTLRNYPAMEYLFYISQIGIAMSPLSNTANSIQYVDNPFRRFFNRGLKVSLSTDQPLFFHFTREPLIEEYSIASKIWTLEFGDLCEVARNSVLISGFSPAWKEKALGKLYFLNSTLGNDVGRSRVSDIRVAYRYEAYHTELNFLDELLVTYQEGVEVKGASVPRAMLLLEQEVDECERVTGEPVDIPEELEMSPQAGAAYFTTTNDPARKVAKITTEIRDLQKEMLKYKVHIQQLSSENTTMAVSIKKIRDRLKEEPLSVRANLGFEVFDLEEEEDEADDSLEM